MAYDVDDEARALMTAAADTHSPKSRERHAAGENLANALAALKGMRVGKLAFYEPPRLTDDSAIGVSLQEDGAGRPHAAASIAHLDCGRFSVRAGRKSVEVPLVLNYHTG